MIQLYMGFLRWNGLSPHFRTIPIIFFGLILLLGASLRFQGLGARSLWGDEFCTWKVSEMPVGESLRWQPELTKPPLYQFTVRGITAIRSPRFDAAEPGPPKVHQDAPYDASGSGFKRVPSEWHLRLPAAVCGALAVAAMWWLGSMAGGWSLGAAGALLFAVNELQLDYSQEARPYSMLVLGSIVLTGIWYRLLVRQRGNEATRQQGNGENPEIRSTKFEIRSGVRWFWAAAYVVVTALTFHANYLIILTVVAHAIWVLFVVSRESEISNLKSQIRVLIAPATAMVATVILCVPMVLHFLQHRTSVFQGLNWIGAPTIRSAMNVLGEITFGWIWLAGLLAAAIVCLALLLSQIANRKSKIENNALAADERRSTQIFQAASGERGFLMLLVAWLIVAWGGLLVISWMAHPAMVARYALPAAVPAILLPLIVLHRWDRRLPLLVAALFALGTAPEWSTRADRVKPGFREMVQFLDEYADLQREAVVVAIERTTSPGWEEMDLLGFEYYPLKQSRDREGAVKSKANEATSQDEGGNEAKRQQGNWEIETSPHHHIATSPHRAPIEVLYLRNGRPDGDQPILRDTRALWMVVFLADPMKAIESEGRRVEQIEIEDRVFDQLYFEPYRLIRVSALKP